jgi:hypothetical protein
MEIYGENPNLVQIEQKYRALYRRAKYILLATATLNPHISDVSYCNCVRFLSCLSICICMVSTGPINVKFGVGGLLRKSVKTFQIWSIGPNCRSLCVTT